MSLHEGMMEFEFDEKSGQFYPTEKIVGYVRTALLQGDVNGAAQFYGSCRDSIGDQLLDDVATGSSTYKENLAKMFEAIRDFRRAGMLFERLGQFDRAAEFAMAANDFDTAAESFARMGMFDKAAACLEREFKFDRAAELYSKARKHDRAAACLERAGAFFEAGSLYMQIGRQKEAARAFQQVPAGHPRHPEAMMLLADLLYINGKKDQALRLYHGFLPNVRCTKQNVTSFYRLALAYRETGHQDWFDRLVETIGAVDPTIEFTGHAYQQELAGRRETPALPPAATEAERMTTLRLGYEYVSSFPLLKGLPMPDVQNFYDRCEKRRVRAGTVLISEGEQQSTLFILLNGEVDVSKKQQDGGTRRIKRLGPGETFGEISAVTGVLPGATVTTAAEAAVLAISREELGEFLDEDRKRAASVYKAIIGILTDRLNEANTKRG